MDPLPNTAPLEIVEVVEMGASAAARENTTADGYHDESSRGGSSAEHAPEGLQINKSAMDGVLIPLKTTLETKASDRIVEVYVTSVAPKQANNTLNLIRSLVPEDGGLDLQHLRRFAKYADVPVGVRLNFESEKLKHADQIHEEAATPKNLFLVVGSINAVSRTVVINSLSSLVSNVVLFTTFVPLLAPTSPEQATRWTAQYWPTVYKKSNPFGPHPSVVSRAGEEILGDVQQWINLADEVARQSKKSGVGEAVGVVVVQRKDGVGRAVAVAGDARWRDWPRNGSGNVTAHAALRAIAMVATELRAEGKSKEDQQRKGPGRMTPEGTSISAEIEKEGSPRSDLSTNTNLELVPEPIQVSAEEYAGQGSKTPILEIFQDKPLSELEVQSLGQSGDGDGYLCHGLEVYCSHEPCVMCSMAIVHSRFDKVVFARRMEKTGGMCADGELGHGLFWRKELNWNMLAWQWDDSIRARDGYETLPYLHA